MGPSSDRMQRSADFVIPVDRSGYIPAFVSKLWHFMFGSMQSAVHRVLYGNQANMGVDNNFVFDPVDKRWKNLSAGTTELSASPSTVLPPSHVAHPYCISPCMPAHPRSDFELSDFAHPVYAPAGTMLPSVGPTIVTRPQHASGTVAARSNPFS